MEWAIGAAIVWLLGGIIWSRIYFRRRHGTRFVNGLAGVFEPGELVAIFIGMSWPITIFTHQSPAWCDHRSHILERSEMRASYEAEDERYEQARREERA